MWRRLQKRFIPRGAARSRGARAALLTALLGASAIAVTAAFVWLVPLPVRLTAAPSTVMLFRDGTVAHASVSPDGRWRLPVSLEAVDPAYVRALLRLEDKRFSWHPGVDPVAMARAAALNALRWRRVSGGSTLTMQLVRVLEPRPRTLRSKLNDPALGARERTLVDWAYEA